MEQFPTCEVTGPEGARLVVHPYATTDSVADLARALDLPETTTLAIDGHPVAPHQPLIGTGLSVGSTVTVAAPTAEPSAEPSAPPAATDGVDVAISVGPACDRWTTLPPGRHTVGRASTAAIRIDDPAVELHHGFIDVATDGAVAFTQLTGAFPATVAGSPCRPAHPVVGALSIGNSRIVIGRRPDGHAVRTTSVGSVVPAERDPWRSVVRRGPLARNHDMPGALEVPEPRTVHRAPPLTTLVGAGIAALGAGALAAVLGQRLFALFAAVGAAASLATWAVGALVAHRDRRRADGAHRAAVEGFERALQLAHDAAALEHRTRHRTIVDALEVIHGDVGELWSRRCGSDDALEVTVGRGSCHWAAPIATGDRGRLGAATLVTLGRCEWLDDVAVPLALAPSSVIAVRGAPPIAEALCRSVIVQLAARYGPADWQLQVVTDDVRRWDWVSWLPQTYHRPCLVDASDGAALITAMECVDDGAGQRRRTVIVVDAPALLSARTGPLRRRLSRGDVSCIALVAPDVSVPAIVDRILEVGDTGTARWIETAGSWATGDREITIAGISRSAAEIAARRLAPLLDPEDDHGSRGLPASVSLAELEPVDDPTALARRWTAAGADPAPIARVGVSADGVVDVDLARDGPHGLVAGTTGSGKSELLRTLVISLAAQASPDHLTMILVDYKGGSTFDACARLPHTVGVVTDLDDSLAERVLVSLDAEVRRRERLLRAVGAEDLAAYRRAVTDPLPRLVVVIDEFASLARELPDFLGALVSIAQRGRSLGIHLLLATQRPSGVVTDEIRANTNLRIALRLQGRTDADDVVGDVAPSRFALGTPGRAALRLGPEELVVLQTADSSSPAQRRSARLWVERVGDPVGASTADPSVLERLVETICQAAAMVGTSRPHRPWIDALPALVRPRDLGEDVDAVGLLDDPAQQRRRALRWRPADGPLLLVGAIGSGTTTAAVGVVAACLRRSAPDELHLYVIDAQGDTAWTAFEPSPHCGAVVRVSETERVGRLLGRLADVLDQRSIDATSEPAIVLAIDGFAAVRDSLSDLAHGEDARRLDRVLRDGPVFGIVAVVTTDGLSAAGLAVPRSATWVFHVGDRSVAQTAGLRAPAVRAGVPGRLRVVESGLEGHVVLGLGAPCAVAPGEARAAGRVAPVLVLPEVVDAEEFDARLTPTRAQGASDGQPIELPIGLAADDLEPVVLRVPDGDHVFIGGAARTGRSTALRQVEVAWRRVNVGGTVVHVDRHRPIADAELETIDDRRPVLVVVDDAERVDDPDGSVGRLLGLPGVTFAVAARLDAVRAAYGHWTREVARRRCGLIMLSMGDVDGELLGAALPRRAMIPPRPGLAWIIDHQGHRLAQVAARMPP